MGAGVGGAIAILDGEPLCELNPIGHYHLDGLDYLPGETPRVEIESDLTAASMAVQPELPGPVPVALPVEAPLPDGPLGGRARDRSASSPLPWSHETPQ